MLLLAIPLFRVTSQETSNNFFLGCDSFRFPCGYKLVNVKLPSRVTVSRGCRYDATLNITPLFGERVDGVKRHQVSEFGAGDAFEESGNWHSVMKCQLKTEL